MESFCTSNKNETLVKEKRMYIPADFVNYKSTDIFTQHNIPKLFLFEHNTKAGVYGKIVVLQGQVKFYGFKSRCGEIESELLINAGEFAISAPQYWHKVELLTKDTKFRVEFFAQRDSETVRHHLSERKH